MVTLNNSRCHQKVSKDNISNKQIKVTCVVLQDQGLASCKLNHLKLRKHWGEDYHQISESKINLIRILNKPNLKLFKSNFL